MKNRMGMPGVVGRKGKILPAGNRRSLRISVAGAWHWTTACAVLLLLGMAGSGRADPPLPVISNQVFVVTNTTFAGGALGNGVSNSAAAINAAITFASGHGGGTVEIPPVGSLTNYMSGPITMASHVNLQIDGGAKLQMFPMSTWVSNYGSSTPFVDGATLTDAEISGSGIIDGQGTNWWSPLASTRPNFIEFDHCTRVLIQNVTLQNPPTFHIYVKNSDNDLTVQGITINTPFDSHNTDGMDISSTNLLIRNCYISDGDDDLEIGGNGAPANNITVSNCTFGTGHGLSIGSDTEGGVNNLLVSNCTWIGTEYGVKGKSDIDRGGTMQNLTYRDLTMSNVNFAIAFYSYYNTIGSPSSSFTITPSTAAGEPVGSITSSTPIWRNITNINVTATGIGGNVAGFLWGLPQEPVSNMILSNFNISAPTKTLCMYNVRGIQIVDSNLTAPNTTTNTLTLYNAQITLTNSTPNPNVVTFTGLGSPSNSLLSVFNGQAETTDASVLGANPLLTLFASTLTVSNSMSVGGSSVLNYGLGTNVTKTVVTGNLTLGGTLNIANAGGFTNATYTLFTYGGALTYNGLTVGTTPNTNFTYTVSTNTAGQVNLVVASAGCSVGAAGSISGPSAVASGTNGVTYSISSVGGATTYAWTAPSGATIAGGQGTTSITVNYACSATNGNVMVTPSNGSCSGTSAGLAVTVTGVGAAGSISGSSSVNAGDSGVAYSISSVSGATTYTWTVPALLGASIASGQGTTSITVNYSCSAVGQSVQVTPGNANGCSGASSSLPVTVTDVGPAALINGPTTVCAGQAGVSCSTFSVSGATTYTWIVPSGATITSGQGTTSITVTWGSTGGNVKVTPANANGCDGSSSSSSVTVIATPATFNVTGGGAYCTAGSGVTVGLDGSESSADYQLELNGNPTGIPVVGTGSGISFTNQTALGTYTVIASNVTSGCTATMNGSASVTAGDPFTCWQLQYFGCTNCSQAAATADPDGDGQNNLAEFLSGTDPTNSASVLTIISVVESGADVHVAWKTAGGHTNIVQSSSGDANGGYNTNNFTDIPASQTVLPGNGDTSTNFLDSGGATNVPSRYYRVRLVP